MHFENADKKVHCNYQTRQIKTPIANLFQTWYLRVQTPVHTHEWLDCLQQLSVFRKLNTRVFTLKFLTLLWTQISHICLILSHNLSYHYNVINNTKPVLSTIKCVSSLCRLLWLTADSGTWYVRRKLYSVYSVYSSVHLYRSQLH